jgi:hypothetical protein
MTASLKADPTTPEPSPYLRERRPQLVLRVGVTGHRPKDLPPPDQQSDLRQAIRMVLSEIQRETDKLFRELRDFYAGDRVVYRLISPLAEGADRIVAEEALSLGYELQSPLPFLEEEYKKDFKTPDSQAEFKRLRDRASAIFELDGSRHGEEESYEAVGRVVLRHCDVLIALWNGRPAVGKGGTGQIVSEALALDLPTIRVKPWNPRHSHLLRSRQKNPQGGREPATLALRLQNILVPPKDEKEKILRFLKEKKRKGSPTFKNCISLWAKGFEEPSVSATLLKITKEDDASKVWKNFEKPNTALGKKLIEGYGWRFCLADWLADCYADLYRSSFVTTYFFGALAVFSAFFAIQQKSHPWFYVELYLIYAILALLLIGGKHGRWHERWIDYRLLAEALRQMDILAPLGRVTPAFEVPPHLDQEDPTHSWFNWYFRAVSRQVGLVQARLDSNFLRVYKTGIVASVAGQISYHARNAAKMSKAHHRLHLAVNGFFAGTFVACVIHILPKGCFEPWMGRHYYEALEFGSSLCAIVLPALGAAVEGVVHQGEFERISRRSKAMARRLEEIFRQLTGLPGEAPSQELGRIAETFCRAQLQEQADWRSVFITKELTTP